MDFDFVDTDFSGDKAHIYTILLKGEEKTLLEQFFEENLDNLGELEDISGKLAAMGDATGCRRNFFRHNEGAPGDGVAVLKAGGLRLYCLFFDKTAVFFGSGGYKPPTARAYQDVPALNEKAQQMRQIAKKINDAIKEKDIVIEDDGSLTINQWDYESD